MARTAGPPSPEYPSAPHPATVSMMLNCGIYPADASVMGVGNEQVALAITRNSHGVRGEGRVGRGAAVSGVACSPTCDGCNDARG